MKRGKEVKMKNCRYCGFPMPDNNQFCPKCGAPQPDGQPQQQVPPQYYNNQPYNNPQNPYSQQSYNGYSQQPYYGNPQYPPYGTPQPYNGYTQQPYYENPQYNGNLLPNYGTYSQQDFETPEKKPAKKSKMKKSDKQQNSLLFIIFGGLLLLMLLISLLLNSNKTNVNKKVSTSYSSEQIGQPVESDTIDNVDNNEYKDNNEQRNKEINALLTSVAKTQKPTDTPKPTRTPKPTNTPKPTKEPTLTPTPVTYTPVTVQQLVNDLEGNAARAKQMYEGNYFEITGYVANIDASAKYISLDPSNGAWDFNLTNVQIFVKNEDQKNYVLSLSKGQYVVILAKCTRVGELLGYSFDWQ